MLLLLQVSHHLSQAGLLLQLPVYMFRKFLAFRRLFFKTLSNSWMLTEQEPYRHCMFLMRSMQDL
jgi:hypothetical protein